MLTIDRVNLLHEDGRHGEVLPVADQNYGETEDESHQGARLRQDFEQVTINTVRNIHRLNGF